MKHFFKLIILASVVTALIFGLSISTSANKASVDCHKENSHIKWRWRESPWMA